MSILKYLSILTLVAGLMHPASGEVRGQAGTPLMALRQQPSIGGRGISTTPSSLFPQLPPGNPASFWASPNTQPVHSASRCLVLGLDFGCLTRAQEGEGGGKFDKASINTESQCVRRQDQEEILANILCGSVQ